MGVVLVILLDMVEVDGREAERGFAESLRRQLGWLLVLIPLK